MSLYLGPIADAPSTEFRRIVIEDAKDNWKYRSTKPRTKYQRRVKDNDVNQLHALAKENSINMGYDKTCDTVWFETREKGADIFLKGRDTGGQFIRAMIQIAINTGDGRQVPNAPVMLEPFLESQRYFTSKNGKQIRKNGKSSMLIGVQMRMWSMRVNDIITILGGDPENTDALFWYDHEKLFDNLRSLFGINFKLLKINREDDIYEFRLTREADCDPDCSNITCSIHTADQILMAILELKRKWIVDGEDCLRTEPRETPNYIATINFPMSRDYHPDAMIYALRSFGFVVEDSKPEDIYTEEATKFIDEGNMRKVSVYY